MPKTVNHEIERCCVFCEMSAPLIGDSEVLCSEYGIVGVRHCCKKFCYDPLKRVPKRKKSPEPNGLEEI